ncbi:MAG: tRNA uridine-5-carboxymethylaminomethyl(34) synthesis enzyme MnmG [bacterium]
MEQTYEVLVIGGGHAGVEAASASARRGARTLLLTDDYNKLGQMSCNPAVGGLAKGQLAREVDAMGGVIGRATEIAGIQFKTLNKSKGPAVQAPRAQCDRLAYSRAVRQLLERQENLTIKQDRAVKIIRKNNQVEGVKTISNIEYTTDNVVLCAGTFLRGKIFIGQQQRSGGRAGERATTRLAEDLDQIGLQCERLKTGTPPRIAGKTVDLDQFKRQEGDNPPPRFSYYHDCELKNLRPCWQGATNPRTHQIIRDNLDRSPLYGTGVIEGTGVRYCPSIEDKVIRFDHHDKHTVFLEPEGLKTEEFYANGVPTSLPVDTQLEFIQSIEGLEEAEITRWGYAIEYDFFQPTQLDSTLEVRKVDGLFFAGQINGTTGYEEAAAQGLVAGINAAGRALGVQEYIPARTNSYLGVLVDELVTKGTNEPFRMFTSRAEHRLKLRVDNAHYRLIPRAQKLGLINEDIQKKFTREKQERQDFENLLKTTKVKPGSEEEKLLSTVENKLQLDESQSLWHLLKRPEVDVTKLREAKIIAAPERERVLSHLGIEAKYEGYINRQEDKIAKVRRREEKKIPEGFNYDELTELSNESKEKLKEVVPRTLGQASRIPGIKPTDVQIIMVHLDQSDSKN